MLEFYAQIKWVHVAAVLSSGTLFLVRGMLVQLGRRGLAMASAVRYLSIGVDTVLLTAALMLVSILPHAVFANGWLAVKLLLLPVYVALGMFALGRDRSARTRIASYLMALLVFCFMLGVAHFHQPAGFAARWFA